MYRRLAVPLNVLVITALITLTAATTPCQTNAEVRQAAKGLARARSADGAREKLKAWGDGAVRHLRNIAERGTFGRLSPGDVVEAVGWIRTDAGDELLVDILLGDTAIPEDCAWRAIHHIDVRSWFPDLCRRMLALPKLEAAVMPLIESDDDREFVAAMIGRAKWKNRLPELVQLSHDPEYAVREAAARSYESITGKPLDFLRPEPDFPAEDLRGLLERVPRRIEVDPEWRVPATGPVTWFDGRTTIVLARDHGVWLLNDCLERVGSSLLSHRVVDLMSLPTPVGPQLLIETFHEEEPQEVWRAVDVTGTEAWHYVPRPHGYRLARAPWYDREGQAGVLLADGRAGLVALGHDGAELWRSTDVLSMNTVLATHVELPGRVAATHGGKADLLGEDGELLKRWNREPTRSEEKPTHSAESVFSEELVARHVVLFPDALGAPALVVAGVRYDGTPWILRLDAELRTIWTAQVPDEVVALAVLEAPQAPRLVAAGTSTGDIFVFDTDGVFRDRVHVDVPRDGLFWIRHAVLGARSYLIVHTTSELLAFGVL